MHGPQTEVTAEIRPHRWVERRPRRLVARTVLGAALLGVGAGFVLTLTEQTFDALAVLVGFTVVAVITYTALTTTAPATVLLDGSRVEIRRGRQVDVFDLAGQIRRVVTTGRPNRPNWRIRFETPDGRIVELGPSQVDPQVMTAALGRYRRTTTVPAQRQPRG